MEIFKEDQYNQGVGKYKVLSSNAGVGSIITTKAGFFVMPLSVSDWGFMKSVKEYIKVHPDDNNIFSIANENGVNIIDDARFVSFLKEEQKIVNLKCLVDVPVLNLSNWNVPKHKDHPLYLKYNLAHSSSELNVEHFVIPAIHFPRWFYSSKDKSFREISEWKKLWKEKNNPIYFVPPRDPFSPTNHTFKDNKKLIDVYNPLVQIPMLLICKNGHISDIPWYQLFCAGIDGHQKEMNNDDGFDLFGYACNPCDSGGKHKLQWIENRNQSESWGVLKCKNCGKVYSLEGIMNIKPLCNGGTPWNSIESRSKDQCKFPNGTRGTMQFVLATSNSVYYADSFSSLFIPCCYLPDRIFDNILQKVLSLANERWYPKALEQNPLLTKLEFISSVNIIDKADDAGLVISILDEQLIKKDFIKTNEPLKDIREEYRFEEYSVFSNNNISLPTSDELEFSDIELPNDLSKFFKKIQQVNTLAMSSTQLGFNRVAISSPKRINGIVVRELGQSIFSDSIDEVVALPANQVFGEGIFFEFNRETLDKWVLLNSDKFDKRYNNEPGELGKALKEELDDYGAPTFYLLHTFSHIILKELEFSCGYPTASLKERLYYSDRMCGVLIYTTDGAEGSMGGLVWQGQPRLVEKIIYSALERAKSCSSDPLCWESDDQMNLAACFSCCLVSETSCEQSNLGLDRRILVDEEFGFFRTI